MGSGTSYSWVIGLDRSQIGSNQNLFQFYVCPVVEMKWANRCGFAFFGGMLLSLVTEIPKANWDLPRHFPRIHGLTDGSFVSRLPCCCVIMDSVLRVPFKSMDLISVYCCIRWIRNYYIPNNNSWLENGKLNIWNCKSAGDRGRWR